MFELGYKEKIMVDKVSQFGYTRTCKENNFTGGDFNGCYTYG